MLPPPPRVRTVATKDAAAKHVVPEETYQGALETIITRDYFPDLPKLEQQLEWLAALESGDEFIIAQARAKVAESIRASSTFVAATPRAPPPAPTPLYLQDQQFRGHAAAAAGLMASAGTPLLSLSSANPRAALLDRGRDDDDNFSVVTSFTDRLEAAERRRARAAAPAHSQQRLHLNRLQKLHQVNRGARAAEAEDALDWRRVVLDLDDEAAARDGRSSAWRPGLSSSHDRLVAASATAASSDLRLDAFTSLYTSEDNASFGNNAEAHAAEARRKHWWLYEPLTDSRRRLMLTDGNSNRACGGPFALLTDATSIAGVTQDAPSRSSSHASSSNSNMLITDDPFRVDPRGVLRSWTHRPRNNLFFTPSLAVSNSTSRVERPVDNPDLPVRIGGVEVVGALADASSSLAPSSSARLRDEAAAVLRLTDCPAAASASLQGSSSSNTSSSLSSSLLLARDNRASAQHGSGRSQPTRHDDRVMTVRGMDLFMPSSASYTKTHSHAIAQYSSTTQSSTGEQFSRVRAAIAAAAAAMQHQLRDVAAADVGPGRAAVTAAPGSSSIASSSLPYTGLQALSSTSSSSALQSLIGGVTTAGRRRSDGGIAAPREIRREATRLTTDHLRQSLAQDALAQQLVAGAAAATADSSAVTMSSTGTPRVRGYDFLTTPALLPGVSVTPIMTWGHVGATPLILDPSRSVQQQQQASAAAYSAPHTAATAAAAAGSSSSGSADVSDALLHAWLQDTGATNSTATGSGTVGDLPSQFRVAGARPREQTAIALADTTARKRRKLVAAVAPPGSIASALAAAPHSETPASALVTHHSVAQSAVLAHKGLIGNASRAMATPAFAAGVATPSAHHPQQQQRQQNTNVSGSGAASVISSRSAASASRSQSLHPRVAVAQLPPAARALASRIARETAAAAGVASAQHSTSTSTSAAAGSSGGGSDVTRGLLGRDSRLRAGYDGSTTPRSTRRL